MPESIQSETDTLIVGGAQAGLATSYWLTQRGVPHRVLERAAQVGPAWRTQRWDSFTLVTPNWTMDLPDAPYAGDAPDGFMPAAGVVAYLEDYVSRFGLPLECGVTVTAVRPRPEGGFVVETSAGAISARRVVMATGLFQRPRRPAYAAALPAGLAQLPATEYRNPQSLPSGTVLVVGSGQSGAQIAEELYQAGRTVYLSVGTAGRAPRRYRGQDAFHWLRRLGYFETTVEKLPKPQARFAANPHVSGKGGGHTLNLHQFARDGVRLLGRLADARDGRLYFAPDLHDNLAKADKFEAELVKGIDKLIAETGLDAPPETLPALRDGFDVPVVTELDARAAGVGSVIWASGFSWDFGLVQAPLFDEFGYPIQKRGVTALPGLYFVGLPWLHKAKSGLLIGVGEDAAYIAAHIAGEPA
jgi:putative flavoprotein involved in K+ transport